MLAIIHWHLFCRSAVVGIAMLFWLFAPLEATEKSGQTAKATLCQLQPSHQGQAIRAAAPNSIFLHNGNEIVLTGILMPTALDIPVRTTLWQAEQNAAKALTELVAGKTLHYALTGKWHDRYGRQPAHALLEKAGKYIWLQSKLVALGHARVIAEDLSDECARELLQREDEARNWRLGLWQNASYGVRSAHKPRLLLRYRGSYQIVEGIVADVAQLRSKTFINFGKNTRRDFTAGLFGRLAATARIDGQPLSIFTGKRLRIRGWITWRGGPFIQIRKIAQISLVKTPAHTAVR